MLADEKKVALVTNVTDYAGPPAVTALLSAGFRVIATDDSFADDDSWQRFSREHAGAERLVSQSPSALLESLWSITGRLDAIVSNDHFPATQIATEDASLDFMRMTFEKLVVSPFALVQAAIPFLKMQGGGSIVMVTSCRTKLPMPGAAIPDAARDAANALVRSLSVELAPMNIVVNAVAPNFLYSEAYYPRAVFLDDSEGRDFVRKSVPVGRLGQPEEIGELICFLAAMQSRFLTGSIIDFSGGWPVSPDRPTR